MAAQPATRHWPRSTMPPVLPHERRPVLETASTRQSTKPCQQQDQTHQPRDPNHRPARTHQNNLRRWTRFSGRRREGVGASDLHLRRLVNPA